MPTPEAPTTLLLDTHVWIWVVEGDETQLSKASLEAVRRSSREGGILISAISVWEVAMLEARRRISLSRPLEEWVESALRAPGTQLLALTPQIAIEATRLPAEAYGDPADRMLLAGARVTGSRLVTRDRALLEYGQAGHVSALDARPVPGRGRPRGEKKRRR